MADSAVEVTKWTPTNIAKLAGLLEGEGCFYQSTGRYPAPVITLSMSDRDVVEWVASMLDRSVDIHTKTGKAGDGWGRKTLYRVRITGSNAIAIMQTVYIFMGERRRSKIRELIGTWRQSGHVKRAA